jgi:hypothetical protein
LERITHGYGGTTVLIWAGVEETYLELRILFVWIHLVAVFIRNVRVLHNTASKPKIQTK